MTTNGTLKPIFIFSLPRSGSTLLQRILASHSKISSIAEPWLLLPLTHMLKEGDTASVYSHRTSQMALEDLVDSMRGGKNTYNEFLRKFIESIYQAVSKKDAIYFLDKTPRYYLIINEIAELFPDAKFIFLFRNPVQIYASIVNTWGEGALHRLFHHKIDLVEGPGLLTSGYLSLRDKAYALQYEDFVRYPERHLQDILQYLSLEPEESMLANLKEKQLPGRMGDETGAKIYKQIEASNMDKWGQAFNNRFRRRLLKRYIQKLPEQVFTIQGYSKRATLQQIKSLKIRRLTPPVDYIKYMVSQSAIYLRAHLFFSHQMSWSRGRHFE